MSKIDLVRDTLHKIFKKLDVVDIDKGCRVSLPNKSKYVDITVDANNVITVENNEFSTTYIKLYEAVLEAMENLVTRELYSKGFSLEEIRYVVCKLIN